MRANFNLLQLGDHARDTRARLERVDGQLARINPGEPQKPVAAGQANSPPGEGGRIKLSNWMRVKEILYNNPELKQCMYENFESDIYVSLSLFPHLMLLVLGMS